MLSKKYRLDPKKIPLVAKTGRKKENELFILKSILDDKLPNPNLAISISVKINKRAVVRNRIKRKIRAVLKDILNDGKLAKGMYLIIVKTDRIALTESSVLREKIEELL